MRIDRESALQTEHGGTTYYFCAEQCREDFLKEPHKYIRSTAYVDPVCGMEVEHRHDVPHITARYQGKLYHFCSADCKYTFEKAPEKYHRVL